MSGHSIIPPSSAPIWGSPGGCTGWVLMAQMYPETGPDEIAGEGEASHEVGTNMIRAAMAANIGWPARETTVGFVASNGVVIDDDMYDGAKLYADDVIRIMRGRSVFGGTSIGVEQWVAAPAIHEQSGGYPDTYLFDKVLNEIFIWDYKYGHGVIEVVDNWQLINYLAGLIELFGVNGWTDQHIRVRFRIVQPRAHHRDGPLREWQIMACDLRAQINILTANAHKALSSAAECHSGPYCWKNRCTARHNCPAALEAGIGLYEACCAPTAQDMPVASLAALFTIIRRAKDQINALESGYEAQINHLLRTGVAVPGYCLEPTAGTEKWTSPIEEVFRLGEAMGIDLHQKKALTPNQARKAGIDAAIVAQYAGRTSGHKLAPVDLKRLKRIFSHE